MAWKANIDANWDELSVQLRRALQAHVGLLPAGVGGQLPRPQAPVVAVRDVPRRCAVRLPRREHPVASAVPTVHPAYTGAIHARHESRPAWRAWKRQNSTGSIVVDALHPSLDDELERFFDDLHDEPRYFGPSASDNPKPFRSLVECAAATRWVSVGGAGVRTALVGVARVDEAGELFIAVTADRRGAGIGTTLGHAAVQRAACLGHRRVVLRTTRRHRRRAPRR